MKYLFWIKKASLVLKNNKKINVDIVTISGDSVEFKLTKFGQNLCYPKSEMQQLVVIRRGKAAIKSGLILGAAGALIGYIVAEDKPAFESVEGEEIMSMKTFAAFAAGSVYGMLGFAGGLIIGEKDIYIFEKQAPLTPQRSKSIFTPDSTGNKINFKNQNIPHDQ